MKRLGLALIVLLVLVGAFVALVAWLNLRGEDPVENGRPFTATDAMVQRGAYLARAGNCIACHTERGSADYAGGRAILTPFGTVYASNLTPDPVHGLGGWSADHFWRAMHNGRSRDGRLLYPAFPYPDYTLITREDSDALFAYLRSLPPVATPNRPHVLRFPYDSQAALAAWRALFFRPGVYEPDPARSAEWNRGAYLVRGLGHCNACHGGRNILGATRGGIEMGGGLIPMQDWYAPSLATRQEAGVAHWQADDVVALLRDGISPRGSVLGPMAEVVFRSTQHLSPDDLRAMAVFLQALPQAAGEEAGGDQSLFDRVLAWLRTRRPQHDDTLAKAGAKLYEQHCAQCHGDNGQGAGRAYPPLAGNRAVTMDEPANLIRVMLSGGFPPATPGNPRPYGMPPFSHVLTNDEIAAVISYIRGAWGNDAEPVPASEVIRHRR